MMTLGIDVAKKSHNATLLDQDGHLVFGNFTFKNNRQGFESLVQLLDKHHVTPDRVKIGMEATGHYWTILYHALKEKEYDVCVINPIVTKARRNMGVRGTKTDSVDSKLIATVLRESDTKVSSVPDEQTKHLRDLTRMRYECAQSIVAEKQRLMALLDLTFPEYASLFSDVFGVASREVLAQFPTAEMLARVNITRLSNIISKASRGRLGKEDAKRMKQTARNSFALKGELEGLALEIKFIVQRINLALTQVEHLDKQLKEHMEEKQSLLKSIPGVGDVWAPTILAEVLPFFHPEEKNGAKNWWPLQESMLKKMIVANLKEEGACRSGEANTCAPPFCRRLRSPCIRVKILFLEVFMTGNENEAKNIESHSVTLEINFCMLSFPS